MRNVLRIFFSADGSNPMLVLIGLALAGVLDAISISALLPAASQVAGGISERSSGYNQVVIDAVSSVGLTPDLPTLIVIITLALVLKNVVVFGAMMYVGHSVAKVSANFRRHVFRALLKVKWAYFADMRAGHIASTLSQNISLAATSYVKAAQSVSYAIQGIAYIVVAILISPVLALASCVFGALLLIVLSSLIAVGRRAGFNQVDSTTELVTQIGDLIGNIKPIKTMNRQDKLAGYFNKQLRRLKRSLVKQALSRNGVYYGRDLIASIAIGIGVYAAVVIWHVPLPELVVLALIFYQLLSAFSKVQSQYQTFAQYEGGYWRTVEQIASLEDNPEVDSGTQLPTLNDRIEYTDINFFHGDKQILRDVTLEIPVGGITVLHGPSGSGKTTLVDLLLGLHKPQSGTITIDGKPLTDVSLAKWRDMIGYVPQELTLLHGSIRDNITIGDEAITDSAIHDALELAGASDFIASLKDGLDSSVGEMGGRLSGGQRQRISLARALAGGPKLLVLDEVTSALDPDTEKAIVDGITGLAGSFTIIVITHRPAWTDNATLAYQVENGRVTLSQTSTTPDSTHAA